MPDTVDGALVMDFPAGVLLVSTLSAVPAVTVLLTALRVPWNPTIWIVAAIAAVLSAIVAIGAELDVEQDSTSIRVAIAVAALILQGTIAFIAWTATTAVVIWRGR